MNEIVRSGSTAIVSLQDESYEQLCQIVQVESSGDLVVAAKKEVMQNLDLQTLLVDLTRTSELLYLASCGVAGSKDTKLSGKVSSLQFDLLRASGDAMTAMASFKESAASVLVALLGVSRYLYDNPPQEDRTVRILARCEAHATEMSETAAGLANNFKHLADEAESALVSTFDEREVQEQDRIAAERRRDELRALDAEAKKVQEELVKQIGEVQSLYDQARQAQDRAENRAFALEIVHSITSAISSGVAAYAAANAAPYTAAAGKAGEVLRSCSAPVANDAASGKAPSAREATSGKPQSDAHTGNKKEEAPIATATKKETTPGAKEGSASDAKDGSNSAAKERESGEATSKPGDSGAAGVKEGVVAATREISDTAKDMAGSYSDIALRWAQAKEKYLDLKMQLAEQQRKALGEIAKYAEQMKAAAKDSRVAKSAVQSLQQAIAALKQIVSVLETAKLFWEQMARACRKLASKEFRETIEDGMKDPVERRMAEYRKPHIRGQILQLAARWYALELIAQEYRDGVADARAQIDITYKKHPSIEEARTLAPDLGAKLLKNVEADMHQLDEETHRLQSQKAQLKERQVA